jgi:beta-galactosidase
MRPPRHAVRADRSGKTITTRSTTLYPVLLVLLMVGTAAGQRTEVNLSGDGWNLWLDKRARWEQDMLYPPPVDLKSLPINTPTGRWEVLSTANGLPVSVPETVEEYFWDKIRAERKSPRRNLLHGDYNGVSWWWRDVTLPKEAIGKRVTLHFESVRHELRSS